jgi:hypothetical protein
MTSAGGTPTLLRLALDQIVDVVASGVTGQGVRLRLGPHEVDFIIDELNFAPALWNGPASPAQATDELIDVAFEMGEIAQRNMFNPFGFSLDAAKAITGSIDRLSGARSEVGLTEMPIADAASVAVHKFADSSLPAAKMTASCAGIGLRSRSIVGDAIDITFSQVAITGTASSEELAEWLRLADVQVPEWGTLSIESENVLRLGHRRLAWLPQLVFNVGLVDDAAVIELNEVAVAGKLLTLPKYARRKWEVTPSALGLSLAFEGVSTGPDLITIDATQAEWTRRTSLEELQKVGTTANRPSGRGGL